MMPRHALARVHHYLQRTYHKPADMRVHDYFQCLVFINTQELPLPPPFAVPSGNRKSQLFSDNNLLDILLFATPKKWQCEMDQMGFDPLACFPEALLTFMELFCRARNCQPAMALGIFSHHWPQAPLLTCNNDNNNNNNNTNNNNNNNHPYIT
jgi:hypothetical protein